MSRRCTLVLRNRLAQSICASRAATFDAIDFFDSCSDHDAIDRRFMSKGSKRLLKLHTTQVMIKNPLDPLLDKISQG